MRRAVIVSMLLSLLGAIPAFAQDDRRVHVNLGGGPTFVMGDISETFNTGWGPAFGVTFDVSERTGVQFEYAYRRFYVDDSVDARIGRLDAFHSSHQLAFNVTQDLTGPEAGVRPYVIGGLGTYYRSVTITQYEGSTIVCDPWLYLCGTYPVESIIGSRGGWDFGINVGGGVGFRFEGGEFFIETRYHYVWGPEIGEGPNLPTPVQGGSDRKADGQYLPLTFGLRF